MHPEPCWLEDATAGGLAVDEEEGLPCCTGDGRLRRWIERLLLPADIRKSDGGVAVLP